MLNVSWVKLSFATLCMLCRTYTMVNCDFCGMSVGLSAQCSAPVSGCDSDGAGPETSADESPSIAGEIHLR